MNKSIIGILSVCLALTAFVGEAQAKRLGGGKSVGMQREMVAPPQRPVAPPAAQQAQQVPHANPAQTTPSAPPAQPKRSWLGPLAGLAAGLGLGALLAGTGLMDGMGGMLMDMLVIGLIALVVVKLLGALLSRKTSRPVESDTLHYAGVGGPSLSPMPTTDAMHGPSAGATGSVSENAESPASVIPADFDQAAFLRVAKVNFVRLQAAFDAGNLDDLREFTSPELFAEIRVDLQERAGKSQQTDVVTLDAELIGLVSETAQHIASVRFHGLVREATNGGAEPIDEIWHLVKPADGSRGWVVAGIQQHA